MPAPEARSPRKFAPRFALRTLLAVMTAAALLCGWLALRIREGQRQKEIYLELFRGGHSADWSHYELVALPGRTPNAELRSTLPVWLERTPLAAAVHRIDKVTIRGDGPVAYLKAIRLLAELGHVRTVSVYGQAFSEADLERLLAAVQIKQLYLERAASSRPHSQPDIAEADLALRRPNAVLRSGHRRPARVADLFRRHPHAHQRPGTGRLRAPEAAEVPRPLANAHKPGGHRSAPPGHALVRSSLGTAGPAAAWTWRLICRQPNTAHVNIGTLFALKFRSRARLPFRPAVQPPRQPAATRQLSD